MRGYALIMVVLALGAGWVLGDVGVRAAEAVTGMFPGLLS